MTQVGLGFTQTQTLTSHDIAEYDVEFINNSGNPQPTRPFKITFPPPPKKAKKGKKRKAGEEPAEDEQPAAVRPKLIAESYAPQNPGPYPQDKPPENSVRFTPVQVGYIVLGVATSQGGERGIGNSILAILSFWLQTRVVMGHK